MFKDRIFWRADADAKRRYANRGPLTIPEVGATGGTPQKNIVYFVINLHFGLFQHYSV
jgi:DNA-binding XRE family transcriptional regulator